MILAASVGLAVTYIERRHLRERYDAFQQSEGEIEAAKSQITGLERSLSEEEARAQNLVNDPVEVEAAIRRIKRGVRDGETVFRVEGNPIPDQAAPSPTDAPAPAVAQAQPQPSGTPAEAPSTAPPAEAQP